ncbi:MAG: DEAD/DEAH box helicase family protein [Armatimonadetes bacterium]|nr:DEAD/DEAH box helicase family protein [Armatimonadota bacterium]
MNRIANAVSQRLSLRSPQKESLDILARIAEILPLTKDQDVAKALERVKAEFPGNGFEDFERDFPSLCFALATGVGKTRLMGAFISYLYQANGIRHFFVLAPNLTIYNKLIGDFTPGNPKYVFQGISEFAQTPPEIITGDNYESGRGVRRTSLFGDDAVHVNIFNISKINSEVRGGSSPRIKRLSEYIGQSYFDYLSELDDLVLLMDESHRYRASAGVRAINELKPILGLELTATPQTDEAGGSRPFKNIIYSYPLSDAMQDGFVKEPAVATRENFNASNYTAEQLEKLKLEDGVRVHEDTKVQLDVYARQNELPIVKPFMLVVAQDTTHADALERAIKDESFFEGRYKNRVITVHSNQRGEERDETVERLLKVEDAKEPTEIVIHVNKLKEGWDVNNLYTIVPLRAAKAEILVHQTVGRGLRLPYGKRTGVPAVDRLTIVAHDKFQEIIDEANNPNSIIRSGVVIGRDISDQRRETVTVNPIFIDRIAPTDESAAQQQALIFESPVQRQVAQATLEVIRRFERLPRSADLRSEEIQEQIIREVTAACAPAQAQLEELAEQIDVADIVSRTVDMFIENSIDIPRIIVAPKGEVTCGFNAFTLDVSSIRPQPVAKDILIHHLQSNERMSLISGTGVIPEERPEDYIVRALIDHDDISYDDHADLLYDLAGQMVTHLRTYLKDVDEVTNVLQYHQRSLGDFVHAQMQEHYWESTIGFEANVSKGFETLRPNSFAALAGQEVIPFRTPVQDALYIRGMLFGGFRRCLYPTQRFDSDPERRFSMLLEDAGEVLKWFKPANGQLRIFYGETHQYNPDFVVETETEKLLVEIKRHSEMDDREVQDKARAASLWCSFASEHEVQHGGKPWKYALIPHDAVTASATLGHLMTSFLFTALR